MEYIYFDEDNRLFIGTVQLQDGQFCPYIIPDNPILRQASAYASMKRDLNDCLLSVCYLEEIVSTPNIPEIVKSSLLFASIVKYARCFSQAEGRGTSLNSDTVFRGERLTFLPFHQTTIELRNKYLAHAGESGYETGAIVIYLNPDEAEKKIEKTLFSGFSLKDDNSNIKNYIALFGEVLNFVDEKIEQLRPRVQEIVNSMNIEEIYNQKKTIDVLKIIPFGTEEII